MITHTKKQIKANTEQIKCANGSYLVSCLLNLFFDAHDHLTGVGSGLLDGNDVERGLANGAVIGPGGDTKVQPLKLSLSVQYGSPSPTSILVVSDHLRRL